MRQVFLDKGTIAVRHVAEPLLDDYGVLVSVHYSFISSGTEVSTITNAKAGLLCNVPHKVKKVLESIAVNGIDGTKALVQEKLKGDVQSLGYSCSGHVIAIGKKVKRLTVGDLVACAGAGYANHADLIYVPEQLAVKVTDKELLRAASITTIGAIALQGIRRAQIQLGERVCVFGLGLLGQLTVQLARLSGCHVVGVDLVRERMKRAQEYGADAVYHAQEDDIIKEIDWWTHHHGVDATIVTAASTSSTLVQQASSITRKKGRVVIVGDVGLNLQRETFYKKEIDLLMSCSYGPGRYDAAYEKEGQDYPYAYVRWTENRNMQAFVELIEKKLLSIDSLISEQVTVDNVAYAYEQLQKKQVLGVVLDYGAMTSSMCTKTATVAAKPLPIGPITFIPAVKGGVRVGIIGAGGFAKIKLMPTIARLKSVSINAVVDTDITKSMRASRLYGAAKALTKDDDLFTQDLVDAVVIASPHAYHCEQMLKALHNGKAVFVEKPMVTDFEQLALVRQFLSEHKTAPVCVDYNRSFAPFITKIKQAIASRHTPLMVQYRMNAGYIDKDHWVQKAVGAGRIIGEACHIMDLFCHLTDAKPVSVSVETIDASRDDLFATDNFCTIIRFDDGSVCSLAYSALGHAQAGKERMEVYFDNKTIVLDDYRTLHGYGMPSWFNESVRTANKGHELLIGQFFSALKQETFVPPISFDRLDTVAELTLIVDQLACAGGGEKKL